MGALDKTRAFCFAIHSMHLTLVNQSIIVYNSVPHPAFLLEKGCGR